VKLSKPESLVGTRVGTFEIMALGDAPGPSLGCKQDWFLRCVKCGRRKTLRATPGNLRRLKLETVACSGLHRPRKLSGRAAANAKRLNKRLRARVRYFPEHYAAGSNAEKG